MNELNIETLNKILTLGAKETPIKNINNTGGEKPFAIVPNDCCALDLSPYFPPQRINQKVLLLDAGSFVDYVNRYKTDRTLIFADVTETSASFIAALDYHGAAPELKPEYISHRAQFDTIQTTEFKAWLAANRKAMTQVEFATWLEDNAKLFTEPSGADLLELVQTLFGKQDVRFTSGVRLQSGGNKLQYDEDVELSGKQAGGTVEIPKEITATFAPFQGAAAYVIRARLKYRIESRKLTLWFETIALPDVIRHSILSIVNQIAAPQRTGEDKLLLTSGTGIVPLLGKIV